jgi:hypothetical protein
MRQGRRKLNALPAVRAGGAPFSLPSVPCEIIGQLSLAFLRTATTIPGPSLRSKGEHFLSGLFVFLS